MTTVSQLIISKVAEFAANIPDWQVAAALNTPSPSNPTKITSKLIGYTDIVGVLGVATGSNLLAALEAQANSYPAVKYAFNQLNMAALDIGHPQTREGIEELVTSGVLPASAVATVLSLANQEQSWCEANNQYVDAQIVGLARGGRM
jgi:hypothetical protein